jgi:hypothetical protein
MVDKATEVANFQFGTFQSLFEELILFRSALPAKLLEVPDKR